MILPEVQKHYLAPCLLVVLLNSDTNDTTLTKPECNHHMTELGVIFDMDGVIIDSEPLHFKVIMAIHKELGLKNMEDRHGSFVGGSIKNMWQTIKADYGLSQSVEALIDQQTNSYLEYVKNKPIQPIPGVIDLLEELKGAGYPLVLASSSKMQLIELVAEKLNLDRYFTSYISGDELPRSKPDPAIYLNAVETLGLKANQCLAIEDSSNGVKSAKAAEIFCIAFRNDHFGKQDLSQADWEVSKMSEISTVELARRFRT